MQRFKILEDLKFVRCCAKLKDTKNFCSIVLFVKLLIFYKYEYAYYIKY